MPEDITYAYIAKREDLDLDYSKGNENVFEQMETNGTSIKITDKAKLKMCLENATSHLDGPYIIGFYYKVDGSVDIKSFNSNHVPVFVEQGL
ncbi:hypothetical protein [Bacillus sp. Bva_UNVM-123]|uniref:hypothetical protein n=1 Tax=Bacillus sp. Bva_UNVM-123 TaxID=2829798 RepID=UPI00391F1364